jgi:hypothetical protein
MGLFVNIHHMVKLRLLWREQLFIMLQDSCSYNENIDSDDNHMINFGSDNCFGVVHMPDKVGEYISRYKGASLEHHRLSHLWGIFFCFEYSVVCVYVNLDGDSSDDSIFVTKEKLVAIETSLQRKAAGEQIRNAKTVTLTDVEQKSNQGDGVSAGEAGEITICSSPYNTSNGKNVAECKTNQKFTWMVYVVFCNVPLLGGTLRKFQEQYVDPKRENLV